MPTTDTEARLRLQPDDRRRQLVRIASDIIGRDGVDHIRIPYVAQCAGVTRPVVYKFFPNRQAIVVAVLENFREALNERLPQGPLLPPQDVEAVAQRFVDAACDAIEAEGPGGWMLLGSAGIDSDIAAISEEIQDQLIAPWRQGIAALTGGTEGEVNALARVFIASFRAVTHRWIEGELTREQVADMLLRFIIAVLREFSLKQ